VTMQLRVTRPAFIEGLRAAKVAQRRRGLRREQDGDAAGDAGLCLRAVPRGYYFKGTEKRLTYPWSKSLRADDILAYYEETAFKDWTHAETGAPVLKAQHPEFEMWNQGIHSRRASPARTATCRTCGWAR